jgi:hypothetical protein
VLTKARAAVVMKIDSDSSLVREWRRARESSEEGGKVRVKLGVELALL